MVFVLYALPVVMFMLSTAHVFINIQKPFRIFIALFGLVLSLLLLIGTIWLTAQMQSDQDKLYSKLHQQGILERNRDQKQALISAQILAFESQNQDHFYPFSQLGLTFKSQYFQRILESKQLLEQLLDDTAGRPIHPDIHIYRLPGDINQVLVAEFLHNIGYQVYLSTPPKQEGADELDLETETEEDSAETAEDHSDTPSTQTLADEPEQSAAEEKNLLKHEIPGVTVFLRYGRKSTVAPPLDRPYLETANILLVGKKIPATDIKIVALALLRAGVEIRAIKTLEDLDDTDRSFHIELDWSQYYNKRSVVNAQKLVKKKKFKR